MNPLQNQAPFSIKLISIFILVIGVFAIKTVIQEFLELNTVNTFLRIMDITLRSTVIILSFPLAFWLWNSKRYAINAFILMAVLQGFLRSLILFDSKYTTETKIIDISWIVVFIALAFYLYTQRKKFVY